MATTLKVNNIQANSGNINLSSHILPTTTGTYDLGSDTYKFRALYADEIYVSANSLYVNNKKVISDLVIDVNGPFLKRNLRTALAALKILERKGWSLDWEKVKTSFVTFSQDLKYIGRWQWINKDPDILADSAHNPAGISEVLQKIGSMEYQKIHFVLGFVNDKDLDKVLELFPEKDEYYFAKANIPRGLDAQILQERAVEYGLIGKSYSSIRKAVAAARSRCKENELIFVGGSIFTVAEIL